MSDQVANTAIVEDLAQALVADYLRATQSVDIVMVAHSIRDHWHREMIRHVMRTEPHHHRVHRWTCAGDDLRITLAIHMKRMDAAS